MSRNPRRSKHHRAPPRARVTKRPWAGFTPHDKKRGDPLARCPSPRCQRARQCIAAVDGLYCLRTHLSLAEQHEQWLRDPLRRELAAVPEAFPPDDLQARMERIADLAAIRRAHDKNMLERWKAGEFDDLYGRYRPRGVMLKPPPRAHEAEPNRTSRPR